MHPQFRRNLRRGDHEDGPYQAERAHPEGNGKHQHQPHDVHRGKAPARIEAETYGAPAEQRAEIVADRLSDEGDEGNPREGEGLVDRFQRQPVVADEDEVVEHGQQHGKNNAPRGNLSEAHADVGKAVFAHFPVEQVDGAEKNAAHNDGAEGPQKAFEGHKEGVQHHVSDVNGLRNEVVLPGTGGTIPPSLDTCSRSVAQDGGLRIREISPCRFFGGLTYPARWTTLQRGKRSAAPPVAQATGGVFFCIGRLPQEYSGDSK